MSDTTSATEFPFDLDKLTLNDFRAAAVAIEQKILVSCQEDIMRKPKDPKQPDVKHQQAALVALLRISKLRRTAWQRRQIKVLRRRIAREDVPVRGL